MHCYICKVKSGSLTLLEHEAAKLLTRGELSFVKWLPADEEVLVDIVALPTNNNNKIIPIYDRFFIATSKAKGFE